MTCHDLKPRLTARVAALAEAESAIAVWTGDAHRRRHALERLENLRGALLAKIAAAAPDPAFSREIDHVSDELRCAVRHLRDTRGCYAHVEQIEGMAATLCVLLDP